MLADSPFQNYRSSLELTSFILKIGPRPDVKVPFMFDIIRSLAKHSESDPKHITVKSIYMLICILYTHTHTTYHVSRVGQGHILDYWP
jgi:hypothetical protein